MHTSLSLRIPENEFTALRTAAKNLSISEVISRKLKEYVSASQAPIQSKHAVKRTSIALDVDTALKVRDLAERLGVTVTELIEAAVHDVIEHQGH